MTYEYAGPGWMDTTGLLAPLKGPSGSQYVESDIVSWIRAGADPKKVVMGAFFICRIEPIAPCSVIIPGLVLSV